MKLLLICAAPRTGSSLLGHALTRTGRAGRPKEFFDAKRRPENVAEWGINSDLVSYAREIAVRTKTPNNVVSAKLFEPHLTFLERDCLVSRPRRLSELIETFDAEDCMIVRLVREDKLDQAISFVRASETGQWWSDSKGSSHEVLYSRRKITEALERLNAHERGWQQELEACGLSPHLVISYERNVSERPELARTCGKILQQLGIDDWSDAEQAIHTAPLVMQRQADELSVQWKRRFELELGADREMLSSGELSLTDRKAAIRSLIRSRDLETAAAELQLLETSHGTATALVLRADLLNASDEYIAALELLENAVDGEAPRFVASRLLRQYRVCLRKTADESVALRASAFLRRFAPLSSVNLEEARAILTLAVALDRQDIVSELLSDHRWARYFGDFAEARAWIAACDGRRQDARGVWSEIIKRQPVSALRSHRPGELVRIDDRLIPDGRGEIRLFMIARDERWRFPWFFAHYRRLGVSRFFVADNGSQDGSVSWLLEQPDTHVFNATTTHAESASGMVHINAMLDDFGRHGWNLYVDADEALVFDRSETRGLRALTEHLENSGYEMAVGPMIDMISPTETRSIPVDTAAEYPFFDPQLRTVPEERCPNRYITGGVRSRMGRQDWLTKVPLTFGPSSIRYLGSHNVTPGTINTGLVALLHYKFAGDFRERFSNIRAENGRPERIVRHESYLKFLEKTGLSVIDTADLQRFESSAELLSTGIVRKF